MNPIYKRFASQILSIFDLYFSFIFIFRHSILNVFLLHSSIWRENIGDTRVQSTGVFPINVFLVHFSTSPEKIDDIISPIKLLALRIPFSMIFFLILTFDERMSATHKSWCFSNQILSSLHLFFFFIFISPHSIHKIVLLPSSTSRKFHFSNSWKNIGDIGVQSIRVFSNQTLNTLNLYFFSFLSLHVPFSPFRLHFSISWENIGDMWVQSTDVFPVKFLVFLSSISLSFLSLHISH
jgi:hypothetical protein